MRSLKAGTKDSTSKALLSVTMSFRSLSSMTWVRIIVMMIMMKIHHTLKNAKCKFVITYLSNSSLPFLTFWSGSATTQLIAANISLNKGRTASLETFEEKKLLRGWWDMKTLAKVAIYLYQQIQCYTSQDVEYLDHIVERLTRIIADPTVCICWK